MKFHVLKPDFDNFDNDEMVRFYASKEDFDKRTVKNVLYQAGKAVWKPGFYMIVGHEKGKYKKLLGCYVHSHIREIATYFDKVPPVIDEMWKDSIKGEEIIQ